MTVYQPNPIDTQDICLPNELNILIEKLAHNNHEHWAMQRLRDGWAYGPERCDNQKHHPCLISYHELTEQEKEYDRIMAISTIKVLLALGYEINYNGLVPPST